MIGVIVLSIISILTNLINTNFENRIENPRSEMRYFYFKLIIFIA